MRRLVLVAFSVLAVSGCAQAGTPAGQPSTGSAGTGSATPYATSTTTPATTEPPSTDAVATVWQLRYRLLDHYPTFAYCDPDQYPVARGDEQTAADSWWGSVDHASSETVTILAHHGF